MPEDERDDDEAAQSEDFPVDEDRSAPSGERTHTEVGPDPAASGDLPGDGSGQPADEDAPLSDLREDVERRRGADTGDDFEDLFTEMDVDDATEDEVWEALSEPTTSATGSSVDASTAAADPEDVHETREVTVVEKRLCQGCPHFSDPPETRCTHDGTTIEAEVDIDHFRVVDCPIVAEREHAETSDFSPDES
jgi:hypothetical protein